MFDDVVVVFVVYVGEGLMDGFDFGFYGDDGVGCF